MYANGARHVTHERGNEHQDLDRIRWDAELAACYARVLRALAAASGSLVLAEDSLQDALVAALKPGAIEAMDRVDGWLYVAGLRAMRRARWRRRLEGGLGKLGLVSPPPSDDRLEVARLLEILTPRQREVIVARFYLGLSYAEIAERLEMSVGAATSTASQAIARMRKELSGDGEVPQWTSAK